MHAKLLLKCRTDAASEDMLKSKKGGCIVIFYNVYNRVIFNKNILFEGMELKRNAFFFDVLLNKNLFSV